MYYSVNVKNTKLMDALLGMSQSHPFYFEILTLCNFEERKHPGFTAGVIIRKNGAFSFGYNPEFIESLDEKQIKFIITHEVQHVLSNHIQRATMAGFDHYTSNSCADMIINSNIVTSFPDKFKVPTAIVNGKEEQIGVFLPDEYKGEKTLENVYEWYIKNNPPVQMQSFTISFGKEGDKEGEGNSISGMISKDGVYIEQEESNKANGFSDEVSNEVKESIIKDLIDTMKARGKVSASDEETLNRIRKSKKNYLALIKREVATCLGGIKTPSWKRLSRKYDLAVGYKKVRTELNVLLDTSGSMTGMFEKVLSYIFYNDITINLLQIDTEVKDVTQVNSMKQLQKMKIKGGGGTELQPGLDRMITDKNLNKLPLVILSDGYCDTLCLDKIKSKVLIISVGDKVPRTGNKKVIEIIVPRD
jgi:predicted metal-dependent peptidase